MTLGNIGWACLGIQLLVGQATTFACHDVWQRQTSGVDASLRGLSVVDENTIWASGSAGTVLRSVDAGQHWRNVAVAEASELDFRDIHAFDAEHAVVISAGQPARIFRTADGGQSWRLCFEHPDERSFFNAISFFDDQHGIAMSDPVAGRLLLLESRDGGKTWNQLPQKRRPATTAGEAGFAASGTNMRVVGDAVFIALGGAAPPDRKPNSRLVYSPDRGLSWREVNVPIARSESSGIFSLVFVNPRQAIAVGGDFRIPDQHKDNIAITNDAGQSWLVPDGQPPRGYRSAVACGRQGQQTIAICVGPNGTDISLDDGRTWSVASDQGFHTIAFSPDGQHAWAAGADGRIGKWIGKGLPDKDHRLHR